MSTVYGSERTCKFLKNSIVVDVFQAAARIVVYVVEQSTRTTSGRQLRLLGMIDETTRECLAIEVARSFTAQDVTGVLEYLFVVGGTPQHIRSDNGPEFVAKTVRYQPGPG